MKYYLSFYHETGFTATGSGRLIAQCLKAKKKEVKRWNEMTEIQ